MARIPGYSGERGLQQVNAGRVGGVVAPVNEVGPSNDSSIQANAAMGQAIGNLGQAGVRAGLVLINSQQQQAEKLENFTTEQKFSRFQMEQQAVLEQRVKEAPDGLPDLARSYENDVINPKSQNFLNNDVPERLRPEYDERLKTWKEKAGFDAAKVEYAGRNDYFTRTLTKDAGAYAAQVDGDPDSLVTTKDALFKQIDNTTLPSAQREALKSQHGITLAKAAINGLVKANRFDEAREIASQISGTSPDGPGPIDNSGTKGAARNAIIAEANKQGVDPQLAVMVAHLESNLDPEIKNAKSTAKGLFQFRKTERDKRGIPDDAPIEEQAMQGVAWLREKGDELKAAGLPVTPFTVYLSHFQGSVGAKALLKAPADADLESTLDAVRPGWKNKDGKGYGEVVMDANNLDDMTVGEFRQKINARVGAGMTAAAVGGLGWNERKSLADTTETLITQKENDDKKDNREAILKVRGLVNDDIASVSSTGKTVDDPSLTEENVTKLLGRAAADEWIVRREQGRRYQAVTSDFESIAAEEINQRLASLAPKPGAQGFGSGQEIYQAAQKKAEAVLKLREADPAQSVANDAQVRGAQAAYNPQKPETVQVLVEARLAAQERAGITPLARSPITDREARTLAAGLEGGLPSQTRDRIEGLITGLQQTYGKHADDVLVAVMGTITKNKELSEQMAGMAKKLARGQNPTTSEAAVIDKVSDAQQASRSMSGMVDGMMADDARHQADAAQKYGSKAAREIPEFKPKQPFTPKAIQDLIMKPESAGAFDETYGPGASEHIKLWQQKIFESKNKRASASKSGLE